MNIRHSARASSQLQTVCDRGWNGDLAECDNLADSKRVK